MKKYAIIMAGGGGTRFWPLSRPKTPKQLLNLTGQELMINETIERLSFCIEQENIFIVTNKTQVPAMIAATNGRINPDHILSEPSARNTAACIGYAALEIEKKYGEGIMVITPSDAYIRDVPAFTRVLSTAISTASELDKLLTVGISPTFPSTGYGYIKFDKNTNSESKRVLQFKEKPDLTTAKSYLSQGAYLWNSGMFVWKSSLILKKFKELTPDIYSNLMSIGNSMGSDTENDTIAQIYPQIRKISIDYAIMEPASLTDDVLVVPGEFGWNDVGSWDMMSVLHTANDEGNIILGDAATVNTTNCILYSTKRIITTVGVDNLIIVETPDAIMVCNKENAQDVKCIVDLLDKSGRTELL